MEKKCRALFTKLTEHFNIAPNLEFHSNDKNSFYETDNNTIYISKTPWQGYKFALTHEFAHALDPIRKHPSGRNKNHDKEFYDILLKVIDVTYSSRKRYRWQLEYARLMYFAHKDGYTKMCPIAYKKK